MFRFSRARLFANCEERILVFTADDHDLTGVNAALDDSIVVRKGTVSPELTHGAETIFNNEQCSVDGKFRRIIKRVYRLASIVCAEAVIRLIGCPVYYKIFWDIGESYVRAAFVVSLIFYLIPWGVSCLPAVVLPRKKKQVRG